MRALVDELARCGVGHACTSPGSRSTPLVVPLVRDGRIRCWSHVDERSGAFFALGLAKATGRPVVLACTSGTAAANYAPAVHEAHEAGVPLVVLTADRPPELRDVGAGQVIDQIGLYGSAAKWFVEVGSHDDAGPARVRWMRSLACRAVWTAMDARPGVVHLNIPLRDPLVPPAALPAPEPPGRADGRPWLRVPAAPDDPGTSGLELAALLRDRARGVIVVGRHDWRSPIGEATARFARRIGWPVLADPLGAARCGPSAIAHYDLILRDRAFATARRPDAVLRIGDLPTSKALRSWLASLDDAAQIAFEPPGVWHDPAGVLGAVVRGDPAATLEAASGALGDGAEPPFLPSDRLTPAQPAWLEAWQSADAAAELAIAATLRDELSEPRVARELASALDHADTLVVASSMPVRDVETYWPVLRRPPRVLSNRGANGIDGTISTAYGAAAAGARTVLLIGDVAFAHDVGGLLAGRRHDLPLTIVAVDNDGGGIFEMLPISGERDVYEEHIATPHGLDLAHAATLYGCRHTVAGDVAGLRAALRDSLAEQQGTTIVEVRTDRRAQTALRRRVAEALAR